MERTNGFLKVATALVFMFLVGAAPAMAQTMSADAYNPPLTAAAPCGGEWLSDCYDCGCSLPRLTGTAGAVILHRSKAKAATLVEDGTSGAELANVSDLDLGWGAGPRVGLGGRLADDLELGVEYFSVEGWRARLSLVDPGNLRVPLISDDPADHFNSASAVYDSRLYSTEIMLKRHLSDWFALSTGFRWVELHEMVSSIASGQNIDGFARLRTGNYLYGVQLGADVSLWNRGGPLQVEAFGKTGFYGNHMETSLWVDGTGYSADFGDTYNRASYLGQIGLKASLRLNEHLRVFGGYEAMWIDGVALAPDFVAAYENSDAGGVHNGNVFYHGAMTGLEWNW